MKKLLILCTFLLALKADNTAIEKKIYESIFSSLHPGNKVRIYSDAKVDSLGLDSEVFEVITNCQEADIVLMSQNSVAQACQGKLVFGTRYRHLQKEYVLGAFFWQKGRPNIVFLEDKLNEHHIVLDESLAGYVE